jgi:hypothetical protein
MPNNENKIWPQRGVDRPGDVFLYPALLDQRPGRAQPSRWHRLLRVVADWLRCCFVACVKAGGWDPRPTATDSRRTGSMTVPAVWWSGIGWHVMTSGLTP